MPSWIKRSAVAGGIAALVYALAALLAPDGQLPEGFVYGFDSSYDLLTAESAEAIHQAGVQVYVQALTALPYSGIEQPRYRIESLRNAQAAGLKVAGYALIGGEMSGRDYMDYAREGVPDDLWDALAFVAVDFEVRSATYETVLGALDRTAELGKGRVLYTNYNSWVSYLGNPPIPAYTWLWNAYWDNNADLDYERLTFGGPHPLDAVIGEQWSGGVNANGQAVDRDIFREWLVQPVPTPAPESTPVPTPTLVPVEPPVCGPAFYTREQALWSLTVFQFFYGVQIADPSVGPNSILPEDRAILRHLFECVLRVGAY